MSSPFVKIPELDRAFKQSLPVLSTGLVLAVLWVAWLITCSPDELIKVYKQKAAEARDQKDLERAKICYFRLIALDPSSLATRYELGRTLFAGGEPQRATAILRQLAPLDDLGYIPAHLQRSQALLSSKPITREALQEAERHLLRVLQAQPKNIEASLLLANLYMSQGQQENAIAKLAVSAQHNPALKVQWALLLAGSGQRPRALEIVAEARPELEQLLDSNQESVFLRLLLSDAAALEEDFPAAVRLLREGMLLSPDGPYTTALAKLYLRWSETLLRRPNASPLAVAKTLSDGVALIETRGVKSAENHALMARLYVLMGNTSKAQEHMSQAAEMQPQLQLELARLYRIVGQPERSREAAAAARNYFLAKLKESPDNRGLYLLAADATMLTGKFDDAVQVLEDGAKRSPGAEFSTALSAAYLAWWDDQRSKSFADSGEDRLKLLREAQKYTPLSMEIATRLALLSHEPDPLGDEARQLRREILNRNLATGQKSAVVHMMLGTEAIELGEVERGRQHLEQAQRLSPDVPEVLNNLAWAIAHGEQPNLPRALALIDAALKQQPKSPVMLDTRGRIYAKLGRWNDALTDLEACLPKMRGRPEFHRQLATVYEKLQFPDLAAEHRRIADEVEKRLKPATTKP